LTALFLIFAFVTAFGLSWSAPTLFGARAFTAATLVPVSATRRATQETTSAGDGRRASRRR